MSFYEEISSYYDYIFPTGKDQINFIREIAGNPPKTLLDIACGTGGYSVELAKLGYEVTAADIDIKMVEMLRNKLRDKNYKVNCIVAGMLELKEKLQAKFELAFCIGNSIVHLDRRNDIQLFLKAARGILNKGGNLVLQIINFDRVLHKGISELPAIINDEIGLTFERFYRFDKERDRIFFKTILTVEDKKIENEIPLFPLMSGDAVTMLKDAGFKKVKLFGDFNRSEFDKYDSYILVIWAS